MGKLKIHLHSIFLSLFFINIAVLIPSCMGIGILQRSSPRKYRETAFSTGTFEGIGKGYRGPINVEIQMSPAGIEDIAILSHSEGAYPGAAAMEELLDMVLETGSTDLDAISGATFSSRGFLEAVEDALSKAAKQEQY